MTEIFFTLNFEGWHRWKDAPSCYRYLKTVHRHVFHVKGMMPVSHANREVEFIDLKRRVGEAIRMKKAKEFAKVLEWSCEMWAKWIGQKFNLSSCEVSEDGENGAIWRKD